MIRPDNVGKLKVCDESISIPIKVDQADVDSIDGERVQPFIRQLAKLAGARAEGLALMKLKAMVASEEDNHVPF